MTKQVLINGSATTLGSTITGLTNMQLGTFTPAGVAVTTTAQNFIIAQGAPAGRNPRISPVIKLGSVRQITKKVGIAVAPAVINVGYAGTGTLNLNIVTNGQYEVKIMNMTPLAPPFTNYTSVIPTSTWSAAMQNPLDIALALANDIERYLLLNAPIAGGDFAKIEVLSDLTTVALGAGTVSAVHGSAVIALSLGHGLVSGEYVRIGSATDTAFPIYKVLSVTVNSATLTSPYAGATASGLAGGQSGASVPSGATLAGLKITSQGYWFSTNNWAPGKPNGPLAVIAASSLAGTPVAVTTAFSPGFNTLEQTVGLEYSWLSAQGIANRGIFPYPNDFYAEAAAAQAGQTDGLFTVYEIAHNAPFSDKTAQSISREHELGLYIAIPNSITVTGFEAAIAALTGVAITTL